MDSENKIVCPKILIVDDDTNNLRVFERTLEPLNLDIIKAHSGQQALEVAHRHDFFLVLMDVQMPDMDGFETASLILGHPKTRHIPIIFVTAIAKDETFEFKGYESGAVDYLTKPINDTFLISKVSVFLQLWQQRQTLLENHNQVEQLNQELTKTIADLEIARNAAEDASKLKSEFLSNVSHELRSPLNAIMALSQILSKNKNDTFSQKEVNTVGIIHRSGKELMRLIDDILDLAKVEAGMIEIEIETFSLQNLLEAIVEQQAPIAAAKTQPLNLMLQVSDRLPKMIQTDPLRLSQIIRNLVTNAIKFTPRGSVTISVKALSPSHFAISVSDTGIGIKPENLQSIFEAFKQEDASVTRRFGGTGLGLSISSNMVQLLDGEIHIQSELNKGSCFTVELPFNLVAGKQAVSLAHESSQSIPSHQSQTQAKNTKVVDSSTSIPASTKQATQPFPEEAQEFEAAHSIARMLANKTILLVEDNLINVEIIKGALEDFELEIIVAENGQVALDKLTQSNLPDIVLMDLMMPVMDGYEAIEKIRENSQWQALPILVITASKMSTTKELCFELGANDYLNKPVDIDILATRISKLVCA